MTAVVRPLVIFLPFFKAPASVVDKYESLYRKLGFDMIVHSAQLRDFLWPRHGLKSSYEFLKRIEDEVDEKRWVVVHAMSIGCYFFTLMLDHLQDGERFPKLFNGIKGQILESPVLGTVEEMARGVAGSLYPSQTVRRRVVMMASLSYFAITSPYTVSYYDRLIDLCYEKPLRAPAILYATQDDPLSLEANFRRLVESWRKAGINVVDKVWPRTKHASALRCHPQAYADKLYQFLNGLAGTTHLNSML